MKLLCAVYVQIAGLVISKLKWYTSVHSVAIKDEVSRINYG